MRRARQAITPATPRWPLLRSSVVVCVSIVTPSLGGVPCPRLRSVLEAELLARRGWISDWGFSFGGRLGRGTRRRLARRAGSFGWGAGDRFRRRGPVASRRRPSRVLTVRSRRPAPGGPPLRATCARRSATGLGPRRTRQRSGAPGFGLCWRRVGRGSLRFPPRVPLAPAAAGERNRDPDREERDGAGGKDAGRHPGPAPPGDHAQALLALAVGFPLLGPAQRHRLLRPGAGRGRGEIGGALRRGRDRRSASPDPCPVSLPCRLGPHLHLPGWCALLRPLQLQQCALSVPRAQTNIRWGQVAVDEQRAAGVGSRARRWPGRGRGRSRPRWSSAAALAGRCASAGRTRRRRPPARRR